MQIIPKLASIFFLFAASLVAGPTAVEAIAAEEYDCFNTSGYEGPKWVTCYFEGERALRNARYATAFSILLPLAEAGHAGAQRICGEMYRGGLGTLQNFSEAMKWYRSAATRGWGFIDEDIGEMYRLGEGVTPDAIKAHMWFNLASWANGADVEGQSARQSLDMLSRTMSAEEVSVAQEMAINCRSSGFVDCD